MIEGIAELLVVRGIGEAKTRQIGSDDVIAIGQSWNEIAKHVGRSGESVQQENGWGGFRAGFAVKDLVAVDTGELVLSHCMNLLGKYGLLASAAGCVGHRNGLS